MKAAMTLLSGALILVLSIGVWATVLQVPSEYPTIQAAIDAAVEGDTVLVADGIYTGDGNRDLDFFGKLIVVMSAHGPEVTIIDCEGSYAFPHRGFYLHIMETAEAVIEGLTIQNGYASPSSPGSGHGGGMSNIGTSPTVRNCTFRSNTTYWAGGGMYNYGGSPTVTNCRFIDNHAWGFDGGGMYNSYSSPTVTNCTFTGNIAHPEGVGSYGGGMRNHNSNPTVTNCTFTGNWAVYGGGMENGSSSPTVRYCTFSRNSAEAWGGGIDNWSGSNPTVTNCTFCENSAPEGGAIRCSGSCVPTVTNCILWDDSPYELYGNPIVTYCDVQGGWPGEGNINADPTFVLADMQDYRLLWGSPCIDTGHPDSLDADGTRRDMGAHFFDQDDYLTLYLTPDATEVSPGGELGVTYTAINRWAQPEPFWVVTEAILPNGNPMTIMGPDQYTLPAETTVQRHLTHSVPLAAPLGAYEYGSRIGVPPSTLYDEDSFEFTVVEP